MTTMIAAKLRRDIVKHLLARSVDNTMTASKSTRFNALIEQIRTSDQYFGHTPLAAIDAKPAHPRQLRQSQFSGGWVRCRLGSFPEQNSWPNCSDFRAA